MRDGRKSALCALHANTQTMKISFILLSLLSWIPRTADSFPLVASFLVRKGGLSEQHNHSVSLENQRTGTDLAVTIEPAREEVFKPQKKHSILVTLWIHLISVFVLANYRLESCWPTALASVSVSQLSFVHALSAMLFSGSIITTTVLEWIVVAGQDAAVQQFWFEKVPQVERFLVIPALTGSMVSGVAQAFAYYGSLRYAPRHVKSSMHVLTLFGLWWGTTDRTTQGKAYEAAFQQPGNGVARNNNVPAVFQQRRISNIVSCLFLVVLYGIMILKPR